MPVLEWKRSSIVQMNKHSLIRPKVMPNKVHNPRRVVNEMKLSMAEPRRYVPGPATCADAEIADNRVFSKVGKYGLLKNG